MVEQIVKTPSNTAPGAGQNSSTGNSSANRQQSPKSPLHQAQEMAEQAVSAGREFADSSAQSVKAHAAEFAESAKEFASEAGETLKQRAYSEKNAGADYIGNIAEAIRRASREFDNDMPIAGVYMRKAASRVEDISDTIQQGDIQDLVRGVQSFARRQPTAFLGIAVLAGFGVVRFLKSSGPVVDQAPQQSRGQASGTHRTANASDENRGYRDEFSK
jgi:type VI protein secretion system component VasK